MEKEKVGVGARVKTKGLKSKGIIEIAQEPGSGDMVMFMSKGVRKKWLVFNFPEEMWRVRCKKEEVPDIVKDYLSESILKD